MTIQIGRPSTAALWLRTLVLQLLGSSSAIARQFLGSSSLRAVTNQTSSAGSPQTCEFSCRRLEVSIRLTSVFHWLPDRRFIFVALEKQRSSTAAVLHRLGSQLGTERPKLRPKRTPGHKLSSRLEDAAKKEEETLTSHRPGLSHS